MKKNMKASRKLAKKKAMAEERKEGRLKGKSNMRHEGREKKSWEEDEGESEDYEHRKR